MNPQNEHPAFVRIKENGIQTKEGAALNVLERFAANSWSWDWMTDVHHCRRIYGRYVEHERGIHLDALKRSFRVKKDAVFMEGFRLGRKPRLEKNGSERGSLNEENDLNLTMFLQ